MQICNVELEVDDPAVAVILHRIVHAGCIDDEWEVLAPLIARGSLISE